MVCCSTEERQRCTRVKIADAYDVISGVHRSWSFDDPTLADVEEIEFPRFPRRLQAMINRIGDACYDEEQ